MDWNFIKLNTIIEGIEYEELDDIVAFLQIKFQKNVIYTVWGDPIKVLFI